MLNVFCMKVRSRSASQGSQYEVRVLYGSEPDLRLTGRDFQGYNDSPSKLRISRSRKKYKAPPAPQNSNGVSIEAIQTSRLYSLLQ